MLWRTQKFDARILCVGSGGGTVDRDCVGRSREAPAHTVLRMVE